MTATVGIIAGVAADPRLAEAWSRDQGGRCKVVTSPPLSVAETAELADLLVLILPPEETISVLSLVGGACSPHPVVVATAPELSLDAMRSAAGSGLSLFRAIVVPGATSGEGIAVLAAEPGAAAEIVSGTQASFAWVGSVEMVSEEALDAAAALALGASGFICSALAGLEEGAVAAGLPGEIGGPMVHRTALATGLLLRDRFDSPADLKDQVASPGGTTIAALAVLEDAGVRGSFIRAIQRSALAVRRRRDASRPGMIE